ncbi:MAG: hypothetical protein E7647_05220 [Ruminococcaceae bacterium]|nr:hypothetical protein [Oscillospiraceae bacterium]
MKKTISLVLIAIMLLSCVAFAVPASAKATAQNIAYVDALYFENAPTIDGYISEAEWGESTFSITAWDCATTDDTSPWYEFFYNKHSATNRDDYGEFTYTVWLRWDLNKFYVGIKVNDPDKHCLKNGTTNTWDGDAVQMRIDKGGANAATNGGDFTVTADRKKPWSTNNVPDFLFGYVEIAGGFSEAWENVSNKGMTSFSNNPLGVTNCVVAPAGSNYSTDTAAGITTYEVAIPWAYIFNGEYDSLLMINYKPGRGDGPRGAIGRELGISMAVLNDGANATAGWDAFMAWGSGICGAHQEEGALAASGSNSVTLVSTPATQTAGYQTYDPTSLLDAKFNQDNIDAAGVYYDYLGGDTLKSEKVSYDSLYTITYDDAADLSIWGAPEYHGKINNLGGTHGNVLDYTDMTADNVDTYIDTRDGTVEYLFPTSYTFEFDIMYTAVEQMAEGYGSELYNWFGGASGYNFQCGYFFNDNAFKVINWNDQNEVLSTYPYDLKKDNWYNWKFQFDNESCNARLWIDDLSTEADNVEAGTPGQLGYTNEWGTLVVNSCWRYYYYSTEKALTEGTLLLFRQMNTKVAYDNVKIYNFASVGEVFVKDETPGGSVGGGTQTGPITGGGSVGTGDANKVDGLWNIPVTVAKQYLSATKLSFTVKVTDGTFEGVKGLNDGTYTVEEVAAGEYLITINNFDQLKGLKAGDKFFDIVIKSDAETVDELASAVSVSDAYTYQNTGDGMVFIILAVVVSILGCAIVIGKRRSAVR